MLKINDDIIYRVLPDNEIVILNTNTNYFYTINNAGKFIFQQIVRDVDLNEIIESISTKFALTINQAKKDVEEFIDDMVLEGIFKNI